MKEEESPWGHSGGGIERSFGRESDGGLQSREKGGESGEFSLWH